MNEGSAEGFSILSSQLFSIMLFPLLLASLSAIFPLNAGARVTARTFLGSTKCWLLGDNHLRLSTSMSAVCRGGLKAKQCLCLGYFPAKGMGWVLLL